MLEICIFRLPLDVNVLSSISLLEHMLTYFLIFRENPGNAYSLTVVQSRVFPYEYK